MGNVAQIRSWRSQAVYAVNKGSPLPVVFVALPAKLIWMVFAAQLDILIPWDHAVPLAFRTPMVFAVQMTKHI